MHRADLQNALLQAVPEGTVQLGTSVVSARSAGEEGVVRLASGEQIAAGGVVGADGIRSTVRAAFELDRPVASGLAA